MSELRFYGELFLMSRKIAVGLIFISTITSAIIKHKYFIKFFNNKINLMKFALLVNLLLTFYTQSVYAKDIIDQAKSYTVKITTVINYAFGLDIKSSINGAGFLIDKDRGWFITNAHVAARSPSSISIRFKDEDSIDAQKIYIDNILDVAIIKVDPNKIPSWAAQSTLKCDNDVQAGTSVIAFGHPWSLDFTATRGIISGSGNVEGDEVLQTDAALNPGNSGGPLIDAMTGEVLGINSSHLEPSKTEGMNFAVPIALVCPIIKLLKENADPAPPAIPVIFAKSLKPSELIIASSEGEYRDFLKPGDRVTKLDMATNIISQSRFLSMLRGKKSINISIERDNKIIEQTIQITKNKNHVQLQGMFFSGMLAGVATAKEAPKDLVIIHSIDPGSLAQQSQFQDGDQIVAVGGKTISSFNDFHNYLIESNKKKIEIIIRRPNFNMISGRYEYFARIIDVSGLKEINEMGVIKEW